MAIKPRSAKQSTNETSSDPAVSYNEFKEYEGQRYTGMKIGRSHKSRSPLGMTGTSDGQGSKSPTRSRACRSAFVTSRGRLTIIRPQGWDRRARTLTSHVVVRM
jgi:hypothetical protein